MNKLFTAFLHHFTFQRQLGITLALGIFLLALFSSLVGSWQGTGQVRSNLLEQGKRITENLARQSALALIYASSENAAGVANATLEFPGVVGVEIHDARRQILLKRGNADPSEFASPVDFGNMTDNSGKQTAAVLDAESSKIRPECRTGAARDRAHGAAGSGQRGAGSFFLFGVARLAHAAARHRRLLAYFAGRLLR